MIASVSKEQAVTHILERSGWRVKKSADNLSIRCPLARFSPLHKSSVDSRPSMGIKVEDGAVLVNCFTCGFKSGQLSYLYRRLAYHDAYWEPALQACLSMESEYLIDGISHLGDLGYIKARPVEAVPVDEAAWGPYGNRFCRYFESRGITFETGASWGVGHDRDKGRALIPVRDFQGRLWGAVGRSYRDQRPKYLNYFDMSKGEHLLGAHMIGKAKSVVLVEGGLDAMRGYQALKVAGVSDDYACISVMGASVSAAQVKKIISFAHEVIIAFDNDEPGRRGRAQADKDLSRLIMVRHADLAALGKKDFGECEDSEIVTLIDSAELSLN